MQGSWRFAVFFFLIAGTPSVRGEDVTEPGSGVRFAAHDGDKSLLGETSSPIFTTVRDDGLEVHMHFEFSLKIQLADGTPVIETLEILQSQVAQTLDSFKPEFK